MGRLTDRWTGTKYPRSGIAARPAPEVRAALLAVNGADVRFVVREGTPKEGADLVAEFEFPPLDLTLKTRMRLNPAAHEVRVLEERWEPTAEGARRQYGRGPADKVYRQWEVKPGADGRRHKAETFRFSTQDMRGPLQRVVLGSGWTWRGVLLKL
ncbi:hypothetical protein [Streptomyces sp. NBC_00091]|uniref:hypothetical protein n=1 Tax=Streptomyces sp. NBC_00091 TaxID=2975648 RepID=UPI0022539875|nr:hypothetical protein [Streptomyces sp. NBC_00091]MCX5376212.1 hypothetical protein [Streptomyces sp. NBC_00091]